MEVCGLPLYQTYVCGFCRKEMPLSEEQQAIVQRKKATAGAAKQKRDEPAPWVASRFVHQENQAKRARAAAAEADIPEGEELDALMAAAEKHAERAGP